MLRGSEPRRAEPLRLRSFDTMDVKCACKWIARSNGSGQRDVKAGGRRAASSRTSVTADAATDQKKVSEKNLWKIFGKRQSARKTGTSLRRSKRAATRGRFLNVFSFVPGGRATSLSATVSTKNNIWTCKSLMSILTNLAWLQAKTYFS